MAWLALYLSPLGRAMGEASSLAEISPSVSAFIGRCALSTAIGRLRYTRPFTGVPQRIVRPPDK